MSVSMRAISVSTRLSERSARDLRGVEALTALLRRRSIDVVEIRDGRASDDELAEWGRDGWQVALEACDPTLRRVARELERALDSGAWPVTLGADCGLAIATLPTVHRLRPAARILWLDAHFDFSDPGADQDWFGGMALSGACGLWPTGFSPAVPPTQVVLAGVRSRAGADPARAPAAGVRVFGPGPELAGRVVGELEGEDVYVHFDPDVLDPSVYVGEFPEPDGVGLEAVHDLFAAVAARSRIIGLEITAFHAPEAPVARNELAARLLGAPEPLLPERSRRNGQAGSGALA